MKRELKTLVMVIAGLIAGGCEEYEYKIEMKPEGQGVTRTIRFSDNVPEEVRAKIKGAYAKAIDKNRYEGVFGQELPGEIGGFGRYVHIGSGMGEVYVYSERLLGQDEQASSLEAGFGMIDNLVALVRDWTEMEMGTDSNYPEFREFVAGALGTDLKNAFLYLWLEDREMRSTEGEMYLRLLHYFYERNYFTLEDVYWFTVSDPTMDEEAWALLCTRRFIQKKLGAVEEKAGSESLGFLGDMNRLQQSAAKLLHTPANRERLKKKIAEEPVDPNRPVGPRELLEKRSDPNEALESVLEIYGVDLEGFLETMGGFALSSTKVSVQLECPGEPFVTNGKWEEEKKQVSWMKGPSEHAWPFYCFATFDRPDEDYQQRHLGQVVLRKGDLLKYGLWYQGLSDMQKKEWDGCMEGLDGGEGVWETLQAFRFSDISRGQAKGEEKPTYVTDLPVELIRKSKEKN